MRVSNAISAAHAAHPDIQPYRDLPNKFRGRCKPRKLLKQPLPRSIKTSWQGHYTPDIDQPNMQLRQYTRQMRRIQSLKHRIQKAEHVPPDARIIRQLHEEWSAILNAPGFYKGFVPLDP